MIGRRTVIAGAVALPRFAVAQADQRPSVTIAVQKISNGNTLDDLREQSNIGTRLLAMHTERLVDLNYQGGLEPRPGLATGWRRIDERTVEFALRRNVKFHNGDVMTAEDVAFSFGPQHMMGDTRPTVQGHTLPNAPGVATQRTKDLPREIPAVGRRLWPALDRVDIVDDHTVRFVNATPDVTMEGRASARGSSIVNRRAAEASASWLDFARKPVGTGPYKVREYRPDVSLIYDAHDEYWGGRPPLRSIRFIEVPEVAARVAGLLSGEYQFACDVPPDQIPAIEAHAAFEVQGGVIPNYRQTAFDKTHPQLRDPRVRLAMAHSVDRQAIVDSLWFGRTVIPAGAQLPVYGDMVVDGWSNPAFDLGLARQLLHDAGYQGDPIPYRLQNNYYTNQVATAQVLVEMWREAGLNVVLEMKENSAQIIEKNSSRGIRDWSCTVTFNDPVGAIVAQQGPNGEAVQFGEWQNDEMDRLCVELETGTDHARRHAAFARMLMICEREDPAYIVLHQAAQFTAKPRALKWQAAPSFVMDFRAPNWG